MSLSEREGNPLCTIFNRRTTPTYLQFICLLCWQQARHSAQLHTCNYFLLGERSELHIYIKLEMNTRVFNTRVLEMNKWETESDTEFLNANSNCSYTILFLAKKFNKIFSWTKFQFSKIFSLLVEQVIFVCPQVCLYSITC